MAKKKKRSRSTKKTNHLSTPDSFRFALNVAVLMTLLAVLVYIIGQSRLDYFRGDVRSKAAPIEQYAR